MGYDHSFRNKKILITCGPTWVPIDQVRVISNISTGQLGQRLAQTLGQLGAQVTLLEGPVQTPLKTQSIKVIKFHYFDELRSLLEREFKKTYAVVIQAAAVSDYRLENKITHKLSSELRSLRLSLKPAPKIILSIKRRQPQTILVGFKLELTIDEDLLIQSSQRLLRKGQCDLVVANCLRESQYQGILIDRNQKIVGRAANRAQMIQVLIRQLKKML